MMMAEYKSTSALILATVHIIMLSILVINLSGLIQEKDNCILLFFSSFYGDKNNLRQRCWITFAFRPFFIYIILG